MVLQTINNVIVLRPYGSLDSVGGRELQSQVNNLLTQSSLDLCEMGNVWVIDLKQVDFIDSSGLVALVETFNIAKRNQCRLVLCNLCASVQLIFEITQLDRVFELFENYESIFSLSDRSLAVSSTLTPNLMAA